jgi:hypothetical protein
MSRLCSRLFKPTLGELIAILTENTGILSTPTPIPLASLNVMAPSTSQKLCQRPAQRYFAINRSLAVQTRRLGRLAVNRLRALFSGE